MDDERARALLEEERHRVEQLIAGAAQDADLDRVAAADIGDIADPAASLTAEQIDDAVTEGLRLRLDALARADQRLREGTYGRSVRSGEAIPDERLEADPAAELTIDEAAGSGR